MILSNLKSKLQEKGYKVSVFSNKEQAKVYMCESIGNKSVGIGGSVSVEQMGLYEALTEQTAVYWHWKSGDKSHNEVRALARNAQIYISSLNAISLDGELVNIDGSGNRVSETFYGHEKVFFVVGSNKITPSLETAINRARNIAAPLNARRLNRSTPCAKSSEPICFDCRSKERICKGLAVFWEAPSGCEYEVILIDENLGY